MANRFCVSLTHAKDNTDKATVGFVVANAAVGSGKETLVFLSVEGVRLAQKGYADDIREEGFAPLRELMDNFAKAGGTIYVCSPCFKKRKLDENNLVAGAAIVGGAKLVEFLSEGSPCVSLLSDRRSEPVDRHPWHGRRQLRRRRPGLRQRAPAPDPPAPRSAGARSAAGVSLRPRSRSRRTSPPGAGSPATSSSRSRRPAAQRSFLVCKGPLSGRASAATASRPAPPASVLGRPVVAVSIPATLPPPAPAAAIRPLAVMGIGSWPRPRWMLQAMHEHMEGRLAEAEFEATADDAVRLARRRAAPRRRRRGHRRRAAARQLRELRRRAPRQLPAHSPHRSAPAGRRPREVSRRAAGPRRPGLRGPTSGHLRPARSEPSTGRRTSTRSRVR